MENSIREGDFVEIEYQVVDKSTGNLIESSNGKLIVPIGKNFLPNFLEKLIIDSKKLELEREIENAYGSRKEELIKILNINEFLKRNIRPYKGLIVNIDGILGIIRAISGGRVIVDFNHPYAGKTVIVKYKIHRVVVDLKEKIGGILKYFLGRDVEWDIDDNAKEVKIKVNDEEKRYIKALENILHDNIPELKDYKIVSV